MLKVKLAKSAGFCFGVKRALEIALQTLKSGAKVYMLRDIVHNEEVARQIRKAGVKRVWRLVPGGKKRIFLIRAHGVGIKLVEQARRLGYKVVDATCPMVKEIHKIAAEMEKKGYTIIVIGEKRHDEVRGILGQLARKAIVIEDSSGIPFEKIKKIKKAAIVVQSTQNIAEVKKIYAQLRARIKELRFFNTVCRPTLIKQAEIKELPRQNQVMIIIGSKNSANTKRLYEISRSVNSRTFWIQAKEDIRKHWFKGAQRVGITAGASTPDSTIREIVAYIRQIAL